MFLYWLNVEKQSKQTKELNEWLENLDVTLNSNKIWFLLKNYLINLKIQQNKYT